MFRGSNHQTDPRTAFWILAIYLSVWVGSAQGLSLISILMDGSHQAFLSGKSDQVRLIFHHPGHQDEHEPSPGRPVYSRAGGGGAAGMGESPAPDHEFYFSDHEQRIAPVSTAKPTPVFKILFPSTTAQEGLEFVPPVLNRPATPLPFKISTTLLSLRTTVLLI